ncbi:Phospholipid hydroperoxide glutathione peroxidase [Camelus dromedarius]|uniref:phospholipid-hydroperoxide glutathione peroxidase n=1 Tax=Camelus dromedarius TaxID=9838 RepID=A0A5N4CM45_CAMDR|nr:Phospholipid hydroperoxide glutathione peroxidase [Camelus dromedarius]
MSFSRLCRLLKPALLCGAVAAPGLASTMCASRDDWRCAHSMHEFSAKDIDGHMVNLDKYRWGLRVHRHQRGLAMRQDRRKLHSAGRSARAICRVWFTDPRLPLQPVREAGVWLDLDVPEPGSNAEIKEFAAGYNVKFDLFSKICVNGDDAHPLWKWMKVQPKGKGILGNAIKWNFTKFLIDKNGCVVKRYGPMEEPLVIEKDLPCYL